LNNSINMVLNIVVIFEANILCRKVEKDYVWKKRKKEKKNHEN
jgi:hypothetical protein